MSIDRTIERIRKLLRLARDRGASEYEAKSAMEMASKIMLEEGLNEADVIEREEEAVMSIHFPGTETWHTYVGAVCGALHACRPIHGKKNGKLFTISFLGRKLNVAAATETCSYLMEQIEIIYQKKLVELASGSNWSHSYWGIPVDFEASFKDALAAKLIVRAHQIVDANRLEIPPDRALVLIDASLASADKVLKENQIPTEDPQTMRKGSGTGLGWIEGDRLRLRPSVTKD